MTHNQDQLIEIFNRTRGRCLYCGRDLSFHAHRMFSERGAWVVDRFVPASKGGPDGPPNWTACCLACSHRKGEQLPWEFDPLRFKPDIWEVEDYLEESDEGGPEKAGPKKT